MNQFYHVHHADPFEALGAHAFHDDILCLIFDLDHDIRTRAAGSYCVESLTPDTIARELGLNRTRVLRMLAAARQDDMVQIHVVSKLSGCIKLECSVERRFKIERAIVIPTCPIVS